MKIVVLNECFFKESHLSRLSSLGELIIYSDTNSEEQAIERGGGADIVIADMYICPLNQKVLSSLPHLKLLAVNTIGVDLIDLEQAKKSNIKVANIPGFCADAVAEQAVALMFAVMRKIPMGDREVRSGLFEVDPGSLEHRKYLGTNLGGKTVGVIGLGQTGQRLAKLCTGLGMKVLAFNRTPRQIENVQQVTLEKLLQESDVISLHLPVTAETQNIIGEKELALMKDGTILINVARGKLVETAALVQALTNGKLSGAGLDSLAENNMDNPLLKLENVVHSPHSGFFTEESLNSMAEMITSNVENFVSGSFQNIVN